MYTPNKKTKLIYILHDIRIGGVEVALISAIPALSRDYDLKVIALGKIDNNMTAHLSENERSSLRSFGYPLISYPIAIFIIAFYILNLRPDILIASLWRASLVGLLAKKMAPSLTYIAFIHNTKFFHKCDEIFSKAAIRQSDHIFTDSTATAQFVSAYSNLSTKITVISFFIEKSPDRKVSPYLNGVARFMFLGRLNKVKNITLAIDTMDYLRARDIEVLLDLYGCDDGELSNILSYVEGLNLKSVVTYKGEIYTNQKMATFSEHHFLIQLSSNEGMAMSVAEAMQNGLVCFTTPVGEIKNYAEDMQTAVFADISNENEWKASLQKIENIIRNPAAYNQISNNCFNHFKMIETYSHSLSKAISHTIIHENSSRSYVG